MTKFPTNLVSKHRPFEVAAQITRAFQADDPGIEYKSIADEMREGSIDQSRELDEEAIMISTVMGIQMPLEKPTNDKSGRSWTSGDISRVRETSDSQKREPSSSSGGIYHGDSDTYGTSFRDELQPDWYARSRAPVTADTVAQSYEREDDREGDSREFDKKSDHGGEYWRFEAPF